MNRKIQYILILLTLTAIAGGIWYFNSTASTKVNSSQETKLTDGLQLHYTFDGQYVDWSTDTAIDSSGNNNNGTIRYSTSTSQIVGKIGQAFDFVKTSNPRIYFTPITLGDTFTFSTWIKPDSQSGLGVKCSGLGGNTFSVPGFCYTHDDHPTNPNQISYYYIASFSPFSAPEVFNNSTVSLNEWHYVTFVNDGGTMTFYLNGVADGTADVSSWPDTSIANIADLGSDVMFDGGMDEARIYNRALSADEISELYNQGQVKINSSQETKLTDGLVGYWTMDGSDTTTSTVTDKSPSGGNDGTLYNTPTPVIGKIGQALDFDGVDDYVDITGLPDLVLPGPFTFSAWVYVDGLGVGGNSMIIAARNRYEFFYTNTRALRVDDHENGGSFITGAGIINYGEWNYVTATFSGTNDDTVTTGNAKIYVNGVSQTITPTGTWVSDFANTWTNIGARTQGTGKFLNGKIDELRVYNRAITADEISQLYNQGQAKINASQDQKLTDGLVGNWTFDGNHMDWSAANEALDQSSSGNDGNVIGSTSATIGKVGQALYFDGSGDYIIKSSASNLPQGNSSFTLTAWVKPEKNNNYIISWGNPSYATGSWNALAVFGSKVAHTYYGSGLTTPGNTTVNIDGSTWYHFAVTHDGTTTRVYLDGSEDGSNIPSSTPVVNGSTLLVARDPAGDYPGEGNIDEVRIYNRALSADEINQLYMMGK